MIAKEMRGDNYTWSNLEAAVQAFAANTNSINSITS